VPTVSVRRSWRMIREIATLSGDGADTIVRGALAHAAELGILVSVAVCDAGGHLIAFRRADDAEIASVALAQDKAFTALSNKMDTLDLGRQAQPGGPLYGIFSALGGRMVSFGGGVPVYSGQRLVGGVGVSGGSPEEDAACCRVGVDMAGLHPTPVEAPP